MKKSNEDNNNDDKEITVEFIFGSTEAEPCTDMGWRFTSCITSNQENDLRSTDRQLVVTLSIGGQLWEASA
jgi:hypothetical protein